MQMQRSSVQAGSVRAAGARRAAAVSVRAQAVAVSAGAKVVVKETGSVSLRGTVRKVNEDRFDIKVSSRWVQLMGADLIQMAVILTMLGRNEAHITLLSLCAWYLGWWVAVGMAMQVQ